jgi:hypothetical protein
MSNSLDGNSADRILVVPAKSKEWSKEKWKIVFLTPPDSPDTLVLPNDIDNNLTSSTSRRVAFARKQRYVSLLSLVKGAKYTSDLADFS